MPFTNYLNVVHFTVFSVQYKHSAQSRHSALTLTFLKHWELLNVSEKKNTRQLNIYSNIKCPRCFPSVTLMRRPTIVAFVENNRLACAVLLLSTETAAVLFLRSISTLKRGQLIPTLLFAFMEKTQKVIENGKTVWASKICGQWRTSRIVAKLLHASPPFCCAAWFAA